MTVRLTEAGVSEGADLIRDWLACSTRAVAFTGAGISTESGIPDFRSPGGVWSKNRTVYYQEFLSSAEARLDYWRQKSEAHADFARSVPNVTHQVLANWESVGLLRGVITQNIDGLHQDAGSRQVLELHGTAREIACQTCSHREVADGLITAFLETNVVPDCPECGGLLKHATISFGQMLPQETLAEAIEWSRSADVFIALGSSLVVEPAASMPRLAASNGAKTVVINRDPTPLDSIADLVINAPLGRVFDLLN